MYIDKKLKKIVAGTLIASFIFVNFSNTKPTNASGLADIGLKCFGIGEAAQKAKDALIKGGQETAESKAKKLAEKAKIKSELQRLRGMANVGSVPVFDKTLTDEMVEVKDAIKKESDEIVEEVATKAEEKKTSDCLTALTNFALKVALAKLKKELLDRIADQTIEWINNDFRGTPRFIENFGDVAEESMNSAAVGVIRDIGLGKLCDEKLSLKFQLNLQAPSPRTRSFTEKASCTLDEVVGNIGSFKDDFRNGGWDAYAKSLLPNNNRFGLGILVMDEYMVNEQLEEKNLSLKTLANSGFKGEEVCETWKLSIVNTYSGSEEAQIFASFDKDYTDPKTPPSLTSTFTAQHLNNNGFSSSSLIYLKYEPTEWVCVYTRQTMPGSTVKSALDSTIKQDQNYIANAESLEDYITVIFDAFINRIIKRGAEGLTGNIAELKSDTGSGRQGTSYTDTRIMDRYNENKNISGVVSSTIVALNNQSIINQRNREAAGLQTRYDEAKIQIEHAKLRLRDVRDQLNNLTNEHGLLSSCETIKTALQGVCPTTTNDLILINSHRDKLTTTTLLIATTTLLLGEIPQPISSNSPEDIRVISSTTIAIERNVVTILRNLSDIEIFEVTKLTQIKALSNMCLSATTYSCPISN